MAVYEQNSAFDWVTQSPIGVTTKKPRCEAYVFYPLGVTPRNPISVALKVSTIFNNSNPIFKPLLNS